MGRGVCHPAGHLSEAPAVAAGHGAVRVAVPHPFCPFPEPRSVNGAQGKGGLRKGDGKNLLQKFRSHLLSFTWPLLKHHLLGPEGEECVCRGDIRCLAYAVRLAVTLGQCSHGQE